MPSLTVTRTDCADIQQNQTKYFAENLTQLNIHDAKVNLLRRITCVPVPPGLETTLTIVRW